MPVKYLQELLDSRYVPYVTIRPSPAYSAQMVAASTHTPGKAFAKAVIMKLDGKLAMAVLPACNLINIDHLRELAGAMPPFGNLYGSEVFVDEALTEDWEIAFNAGSHRELVRMAYSDFERLATPKVARFSYKTP